MSSHPASSMYVALGQLTVLTHYRQSRKFFDLEKGKKGQLARSLTESPHHGYSSFGNEQVRGEPCLKENLDFDPRQWREQHGVECLPGFNASMESFHTVRIHLHPTYAATDTSPRVAQIS